MIRRIPRFPLLGLILRMNYFLDHMRYGGVRKLRVARLEVLMVASQWDFFYGNLVQIWLRIQIPLSQETGMKSVPWANSTTFG